MEFRRFFPVSRQSYTEFIPLLHSLLEPRERGGRGEGTNFKFQLYTSANLIFGRSCLGSLYMAV
jgi:hypothetical protein